MQTAKNTNHFGIVKNLDTSDAIINYYKLFDFNTSVEDLQKQFSDFETTCQTLNFDQHKTKTTFALSVIETNRDQTGVCRLKVFERCSDWEKLVERSSFEALQQMLIQELLQNHKRW